MITFIRKKMKKIAATSVIVTSSQRHQDRAIAEKVAEENYLVFDGGDDDNPLSWNFSLFHAVPFLIGKN